MNETKKRPGRGSVAAAGGVGTAATGTDAETLRLAADARREQNWKRWGPYLSERQWGTVREDYSEHGDCWNYLPHDHARSRAYRWGEDGLLGITDRQCRMAFALALWNGRDPILKERLFGLTGPEGNHGEDVKELYYYLDATPTHSYLKALYKYPQAEYPYARLVQENRNRGKLDREFELADSGVLDGNRYFDVQAEYAKVAAEDILVRITVTNRGPENHPLHLLPTLWFRNTWSWGAAGEDGADRPLLTGLDARTVRAEHPTLGTYRLVLDADADLLFTGNDTNSERIFGLQGPSPYVKDSFHAYVVGGQKDAVDPAASGTKSAFHLRLDVPAGKSVVVRLRLFDEKQPPSELFGAAFDAAFTQRIAEADAFYAHRIAARLDDEGRRVARQAYAGLLWSKQFYHYGVNDWLAGDAAQPPPPESRQQGRNHDWGHLYNRDVISMPDKWEYPWYACWDLAFHMIPFATVDPDFAKAQLVLFLREWYMHPNGQLPAYEFAFNDVNPPVHAWACWRVYKMTGARGQRDKAFLARAFQKLLLNFTWWVNRKDLEGHHLFSGGFLGLDNIGVFDRSKPLPTGGHLEQADGTAWMAFYCNTMLAMALELAEDDPAYEDMASKFFEHFVAIADAINSLGGTGLWDEQDGFYYDQLHVDGRVAPLRIRSLVGLMPLITALVLEQPGEGKLKGFQRRTQWFFKNRQDLAGQITLQSCGGMANRGLLAIPNADRLRRVLRCMLDENEFLSPYGLRSVSKVHKDHPYHFHVNGDTHTVSYQPAESESGLFGGNSNWRGPIWFPINFLLVEALERFHYFYGDDFKVECPTGSGVWMTLKEVARELSRRLSSIFIPGPDGRRPCFGEDDRSANDPAFKDLVQFHEYFHGDTGRGLGASHQTGWTALVAKLLG